MLPLQKMTMITIEDINGFETINLSDVRSIFAENERKRIMVHFISGGNSIYLQYKTTESYELARKGLYEAIGCKIITLRA